MKNDDPKNSATSSQEKSQMNKTTELIKAKATKDKQKQLDKLKAQELEAKKLKANEFRSDKASQQTVNADLVADKSAAVVAENQQANIDEEQISAVDTATDDVITGTGTLSNEINAEQQVDTIDSIAEAIEPNAAEIAQQGQRIGKGGGVTTPAGVTFDITNGIKDGLIAGGFLGAVHSEIHHGAAAQNNLPQGTVIGGNIGNVAPDPFTTTSAKDGGVATTQSPQPDVTLSPQVAPQLIPVQVPDKAQQLTPEPLLGPQLTPGQVPDKIQQLTPDSILPPQLTPGQIPYQVPNASPNATPMAVPGQVPKAMHQEIPLSAVITIDAITKDNIINANEAKGNVHVTGTVGGDVIDGDTITLTVNGKSFTGLVQGSHFDIAVTGSDLALDNNVQAQVTVANLDGRSMTATDGQNYDIDTDIDINVHSFYLNQAKGEAVVQIYLPDDTKVTELTITSSGGGQALVLDPATFFSQSSSARNPDHNYINFRGVDISSLPDGELTVHVKGEDTAGNLVTSSRGGTVGPVILDTQISATDDINTATEDQGPAATSGNVLTNDDQDGTSIIAADIKGTYGTFHFKADGSYTYQLDNSKVQSFAAGEKHDDHSTYIVTDAAGNSAIANLTVTIEGKNDSAAITGQTTADLTEDVDVNALFSDAIAVKGALVSTDVDNPNNLFKASVLTDSDGGGFAILKSGDWYYQIPNSEVQHLAAKEVITHTFTVETVDGTEQQITVTITGTNDAPVLSVNQSSNTSGTLTEADVDTTDTHSFETSNGVGNYGTLIVDPSTGAYSYSQNPSVAGMNYDSSTGTYSGKEVFAVEVKDNQGGVDTKYIEMTVSATVSAGNPPVITTQVTSVPVVTNTQPAITTTQTTPPTNTVTIDLATSSDSGVDHNDNITNDNSPSITGTTALPFSKVEILENGKVLATTTSDAQGIYQVDTPSLIDANHDLTAQATAPSASTAVTSSALSVTVDTLLKAPSSHLLASSDTGSSHNDLITYVTTPTIDGNVEPNAQVVITTSTGVVVGKGAGNSAGAFSITTTQLSEGSNALFVTATDTAGNSEKSLQIVVVDTTDPIPTLSIDPVTADNIVNASESGGDVNITGTVGGEFANGDMVTLTVNGTDYTGTVDAGGKYIIAVAGSDLKADSNTEITGSVSHTDAAGNTGTATINHGYTVDTSAPTVPVINALPTDTNNPTPTVSGSGEAGATVSITDGSKVLGSAVVGSNGQWTFTSPILGQGAHNISATQTDTSGNPSAQSTNHAMNIDTTDPVPTLSIDPVTADNIVNASESGGDVNVSGTVGGEYASSDTVTLTVNNRFYTGRVDAAGKYTIAVAGSDLKADSNTEITGSVSHTDAAGNTGTATINHGYTVDTSAPVEPTVSLIAPHINSHTPLIVGTGEVGAQVTVTDGKAILGTVVVDNKGQWTLTSPTLIEGSHSISASQTDIAGNTSGNSIAQKVDIDTQASLSIDPISKENILDISEQQQSLDISGSVTGVEDGQLVTISIDGHTFNTDVQHGVWSISLSSNQVQAFNGGINNVLASVSDLAGNKAEMNSPLFIADAINQPPSMSFKVPPIPTSGGHLGAHISGDLVAPPLLQQLSPPLGSGGWAISDGHGHAVTSLRGHYGTLTIDPDTGHVEYIYNHAPTLGAKAAGGTHHAGQTISEENHDLFKVIYHDSHASNVDVTVNLDVTYIHGHSGQNHMSTQLVDMNVSPVDSQPAPAPPPPSEDEFADVATQAHEVDTSDLSGFEHISEQDSQADTSSPVDHYLDMLGISKDKTVTSEQTASADDLLAPVTTSSTGADVDPLVDDATVDPFDSPLDDDKHQHDLTALDDSQAEQGLNELLVENDDDSLHQALNDMHSQF